VWRRSKVGCQNRRRSADTKRTHQEQPARRLATHPRRLDRSDLQAKPCRRYTTWGLAVDVPVLEREPPGATPTSFLAATTARPAPSSSSHTTSPRSPPATSPSAIGVRTSPATESCSSASQEQRPASATATRSSAGSRCRSQTTNGANRSLAANSTEGSHRSGHRSCERVRYRRDLGPARWRCRQRDVGIEG
jgi:hypothetical protein